MQIRWYQHSTHGGKPKTLLKYKLPATDRNEIVQARYNTLFLRKFFISLNKPGNDKNKRSAQNRQTDKLK